MLKRYFVIVCMLALVLPGNPVWGQTQNEVPAGTEIQLTLRDPLSSKLSEPGDEVIATIRRDVVVDGRTVLRQGTEVIGRVTLAEAAGRVFKGGRLHITFDRIRIDGLEQKLTAVIKSASDFTRDEKIKTDDEGTLKGGKDGGKTLQNVGAAAGIGMIGVTIANLAGRDNNRFDDGHEQLEDRQVDAEADDRDREEAGRLKARVRLGRALVAERPVAID